MDPESQSKTERIMSLATVGLHNGSSVSKQNKKDPMSLAEVQQVWAKPNMQINMTHSLLANFHVFLLGIMKTNRKP